MTSRQGERTGKPCDAQPTSDASQLPEAAVLHAVYAGLRPGEQPALTQVCSHCPPSSRQETRLRHKSHAQPLTL